MFQRHRRRHSQSHRHRRRHSHLPVLMRARSPASIPIAVRWPTRHASSCRSLAATAPAAVTPQPTLASLPSVPRAPTGTGTATLACGSHQWSHAPRRTPRRTPRPRRTPSTRSMFQRHRRRHSHLPVLMRARSPASIPIAVRWPTRHASSCRSLAATAPAAVTPQPTLASLPSVPRAPTGTGAVTLACWTPHAPCRTPRPRQTLRHTRSWTHRHHHRHSQTSLCRMAPWC